MSAGARPRAAVESEAASGSALPRLLAGASEPGALGLDDHIDLHGPLPPRRADHRVELIERVERSGLRGRGGSAFATGRKLRAVAVARGRKVVVVNGAEGEPLSRKDRMLLRRLPHLALDGAELAADVVGADEVIVCVCRSARAAQSVAQAIAERERIGQRAAAIRLAVVPYDYLAGEESALIRFLNGGPAKPTFKPPRPFEKGIARRATLVNNVETLAHLALIARHGSRWFRTLGVPSQPGTALVTVSGPLARPGVYEIEYGCSLQGLIDAAGGATADLRGVLLGGYAGSWIPGRLLPGVRLSDEQLATHGATIGAGIVALLSTHACPVRETAAVADWLAQQSAAQCGPCAHGLPALAGIVADIAEGLAAPRAVEQLARVAALVRGRGACRHPDGAVSFIASAARAFAPEFADHARNGPCEACAATGELALAPGSREARSSGHRPTLTRA